jgi:hypothetical protein
MGRDTPTAAQHLHDRKFRWLRPQARQFSRGIPKFRMTRPAFATTSADEIAAVIDGSYFEGRKPDPALAYRPG